MGEKWGLGLLTAGGCLGVTWFNRWLFFRTVSACVQSQPPLRISKREHLDRASGALSPSSPPAQEKGALHTRLPGTRVEAGCYRVSIGTLKCFCL